ncbi:MAG: hypothetical protein LBI62_02875 [Candidatus Accumulibacter sp.]|jgi:hypothetical protein|nr:hypothetical protein [Accumulibacter sp.]
MLAKEFPSKKANRFIEWFTYSEEIIDSKSKTKACVLFDSSLLDTIEIGTVKPHKTFGGVNAPFTVVLMRLIETQGKMTIANSVLEHQIFTQTDETSILAIVSSQGGA